MVQIAGNPFTQLLNLNVLNELRVDGVLINPNPVGNFVEVAGNYVIQDDDALVILSATGNLTLPTITTIQRLDLIVKTGATGTLIASGGASIPIGSSPIAGGTSLTLTSSLVSNEWLGT